MTVILRKPVVSARTGYSTRHIDRLAKLGLFPAPARIGAHVTNGAVGFVESEVEEWLSERVGSRAETPVNSRAA